MKPLFYAQLAACLTIVCACSGMGSLNVQAGDSEASVIARLGRPTHQFQDGANRLLEYARGPFGQETYMARFGADNELISFEQVLTLEKFATLKVGVATKEDVLYTVGSPSEKSYLSRLDLEVWSYPYKEAGVWNSIMHVHFDKGGTVRIMQNGPDMRFDPDTHWPFRLSF